MAVIYFTSMESLWIFPVQRKTEFNLEQENAKKAETKKVALFLPFLCIFQKAEYNYLNVP